MKDNLIESDVPKITQKLFAIQLIGLLKPLPIR